KAHSSGASGPRSHSSRSSIDCPRSRGSRRPRRPARLFYGPDVMEGCERAAMYVDRILNGVKPADLPVEPPTKIDLVINVKTAKALGVRVPQSLLLRVDRIVE